MIRTLQDHGVHQGIDVYMECTVTRLLKDGERVAGAFGYWRETRTLRCLQSEVGRDRDRRHRQSLADHFEFVGVHRRRHGAGVSTPART